MKFSPSMLAITLGAAVVGGIAGALLQSTLLSSAPGAESAISPAVPDQRLAGLEQRLDDERVARLLLEKQLAERFDLAAAVSTPSVSLETESIPGQDDLDAGLREILISQPEEAGYDDPSDPAVRRRLELEAVGFARDEIAWIEQQEAEIALENLYAQFEARRAELQENGAASPSMATGSQLRERLGDEYYEKYRQANGMPTSAWVRNVMQGSPAQNAGLQAGDEIVSYGGQRVFDFRDINTAAVQGEPGESVLLEITRDGEPLQLTIPRGPLGVSGQRWRGRR